MDPTGTGLAIHYNKWRDVEVKEICDCFEALPANATIKSGDVLWKPSEPYAYSAGKVYGYEKIKVTSVHQTNQGTQVDYQGSVSSGRSILRVGQFYRLSDVDRLVALVKEHGHKITHVHDPKHEAEVASTRKAFEAEWDARGFPR